MQGGIVEVIVAPGHDNASRKLEERRGADEARNQHQLLCDGGENAAVHYKKEM